jgi:hypothetical protein
MDDVIESEVIIAHHEHVASTSPIADLLPILDQNAVVWLDEPSTLRSRRGRLASARSAEALAG